MCGIVGYAGHKQAAPILLDGLAKLEYRGYDSAGICVYNDHKLPVFKAKGRLSNLSQMVHGGADVPGVIGIEEFQKVALRVGQIVACEPVPKSDKLLKLSVDLGSERRQVVSGIAKFYTPESLVGKKIILVANLKPVKLRGVESNGMILASGEDEIKVVFVDDSVPNGSTVR